LFCQLHTAFFGYDVNEIDVLVADYSNPNYKNNIQHIPATVTINPDYTFEATPDGAEIPRNDVAVLKLSQPVSSSKVIPMCRESYSNYTIAVCGMGDSDWLHPNKDKTQLQETQLQEKNPCLDKYGQFPDFDNNTQICLGPIRNQGPSSTCSGDAGGPAYPLSTSGQPLCVYGIVSYFRYHCDGNSLYTRVPYYYDWIKQQMQ